MSTTISKYKDLVEQAKAEIDVDGLAQKTIIRIGDATCENAAGARDVEAEFRKLVEASGRNDIVIKKTGCTGRCAAEPIVSVKLPGMSPYKYEYVSTEKVQRIFTETVQNKKMVIDFLLDKKTKNVYHHMVTFLCSSVGGCEDLSQKIDKFYEYVKEAGIEENSVKAFEGSGFGFRDEEKSNKFYMLVYPEDILYHITSDEDIKKIVNSCIKKRVPVEELRVHKDFLAERFFDTYGDVSFFNKQTRLTLRNSGIIDPESLNDYVFYNGFESAYKVLSEMTPGEVIDEVKKSGLRGRGGGGFPTGIKWENTGGESKQRYLICNADEGDPGAFMDRSALEGDPYSVIEGMIIGAYAIKADKGYVYLRAEYPLAIKRLEKAIAKCREKGILGENIFGSGFHFDLEIRLGAGAFVCGEETALMHSIEGLRGQPRIKPPFPSQSGLWGHPTSINNVETFANIPVIFQYGSDWFASIGTENSTGTKVFALAGDVVNTGLVEVPMGTTLHEIIYDIGGGIPGGKKLKAVQTGGPSGGCIPAEQIDTTVDYDSLKEAGSIMGSGGMIVLDEDNCMVDVARFFLDFTKDESCGKCTPCREGTTRMLEILNRMTEGQGTLEDLEKLERLAKTIQKASLCGLGQTAPNPVLSNIKNFREEFEAHVVDKKCPAGKCSKLLNYVIKADKCIGCRACAKVCPVSCISGKAKEVHVIDQSECTKCGQCYETCRFDAIIKE